MKKQDKENLYKFANNTKNDAKLRLKASTAIMKSHMEENPRRKENILVRAWNNILQKSN